MESSVKKEDVFGKELVAVAGYDAFGKKFISTLNIQLKESGVYLIGINIRDEDFDFFIKNLLDSKVKTTIFMPEFQKRVGEFFGKSGAVLMISKKESGEVLFELSDKKIDLDERNILELIRRIV